MLIHNEGSNNNNEKKENTKKINNEDRINDNKKKYRKCVSIIPTVIIRNKENYNQ